MPNALDKPYTLEVLRKTIMLFRSIMDAAFPPTDIGEGWDLGVLEGDFTVPWVVYCQLLPPYSRELVDGLPGDYMEQAVIKPQLALDHICGGGTDEVEHAVIMFNNVAQGFAAHSYDEAKFLSRTQERLRRNSIKTAAN